METVSVGELRDHGEEVPDRVAHGSAVIVTRDGTEVAGVRPRSRHSPTGAELIARRRLLRPVDLDVLRADLDEVLDAAL